MRAPRRRTCSPSTPSGSRLVARSRTSGQMRSSCSISALISETTCSQLSTTTSIRRVRAKSAMLPATVRPGRGATPRLVAATWIAESASIAGASSMNQQPSRCSWTTHAAVSIARRVLPTPPGPTSVTSRERASASRVAARSAVRPTKEVSWRGRLPGCSNDRSGGNSAGSARCTSWNTCIDSARSRRRCSPRSTTSAPSGSASCARASAAPESRTWPPWAAAMRRAHRFKGRLRYSPSRTTASSACSPIRTFRGPVAGGQVASVSARWAPSTAVIADRVEENATAMPSPIVLNTTPPFSVHASVRMRLWSASASAIASGDSSHRRVEASMSVNRKVTVPVGRAAWAPTSGPGGAEDAAPRKCSLRRSARSSVSRRSSSFELVKERYDTEPVARRSSRNASSRGSRSGDGVLR